MKTLLLGLASLALLGALVLGLWKLNGSGPESDLTTGERQSLLIYSATDRTAIAPLLDAFQARHPAVTLDYREFNTMELDQKMRQLSGDEFPDLVISSAMDLQIRLVNDGFAQAFENPVLNELPGWANWRNEAFGFSYEPIVFVYNKAAFNGRDLPRTHEDLATALRSDGPFSSTGSVPTMSAHPELATWWHHRMKSPRASVAGCRKALGVPSPRSTVAPPRSWTPLAPVNWCWVTTCWAPMRWPAPTPIHASA
ncbi:ABC transporter substrate-binding protein [Marinobacterium rhizophilum]|uniref:ABC transporter substrate-binding protein n=1 Tax=Marinobacterium rhizophilum TaxID=420402 RepID=UPI00039A905F|nr:extracellular solute-binding protein [Marinobacterium rhizophilum]